MHRYSSSDRDDRFQENDRNSESRPYGQGRDVDFERGHDRPSLPRYEDDTRSATRAYGSARDEGTPRNFGEWRESTRQEPNYTRDMQRSTGSSRGYANSARTELPQDYSDFRPAWSGEDSRGGRTDSVRGGRGGFGESYGSGSDDDRFGSGRREVYGSSSQRGSSSAFSDGDRNSRVGGAFSSMGGTSNGTYSSQSHPSTSFAGKGPKGFQRSDERIRETVCERLESAHEVDASDIEVEVKDGEVTLKGTVGSRSMKRSAEDHVESLSGVKDVTNNLRVKTVGAREERDSASNERSNSSTDRSTPSTSVGHTPSAAGSNKNSSRAGSVS